MKPEPRKNIEQIYVNTAYTQSLLATMRPQTASQCEAIDNAREILVEWEKVSLTNIRKAFEK